MSDAVVRSVLIACGALSIPGAVFADPQAQSFLHWVFDGNVDGATRLGDTLYVGGAFSTVEDPTATTGVIARSQFAAIDLRSGTLLPWAPAPIFGTIPRFFSTVDGAVLVNGSQGILGLGWRLLDPVTGAILRNSPHLPYLSSASAVFAFDESPNEIGHTPVRIARNSLAPLRPWVPAFPVRVADGTSDDTVVVMRAVGSGMAALDAWSGAMLWRRWDLDLGAMALSGDTLYVGQAQRLLVLDARSGRTLRSIETTGPVLALHVADGRLIVYGGVPGTAQTPPATPSLRLLTLMGDALAWDPGLAISPGARVFIESFGDVLVTGGAFESTSGPTLRGLAAFRLDGARAPSALRAVEIGESTEFRWTPAAQTPAAGYELEVGLSPGATMLRLPVGAATRFSSVVPVGTYYVRVRSVGGPSDAVSNEIVVQGGCIAPPPAPTGMASYRIHNAQHLWWAPADGGVSTTAYTLQVGTAPGQRDVGTWTLPAEVRQVSGEVPQGTTYYARVSASNACGTSATSREIVFTQVVPRPPHYREAVQAPFPPDTVYATVQQSTVSLGWSLHPWYYNEFNLSGFVLEVGSAAGRSDIGVLSVAREVGLLTVPNVPAGIYFVRVRGLGPAGLGAPSHDVRVVVP